MKKQPIISMKKEASAFHMTIALLLALGIMLCINALIGGMGGMPALVGFFCMYSFLKFFQKGKLSEKEENPEKMAKKEIRQQMFQYGIGYLLIWTVMNLVVFLSRISGWGSINGMTVGSYIRQMLNSTMLEKWAYFFAGILMFTYIMSLFPLVVIKRRKVWALYVLGDTGVFVLACGMIAGICQKFFVAGDRRSWAKCVLDDLLMCQMEADWQPTLFLIGIFLVLVVVIFFVYFISKQNFGKEELPAKKILKKENILIPVLVAVCLTAGAVAYFFFGDNSTRMEYHKVAECLTKDSYFGPMTYDGNIYLPVKEENSWNEDLTPLGYLGYKGQNCDSRFYELAISNLLYTEKGTMNRQLWMEGADHNYYRSALEVEEAAEWKEKNIFLLWDEEWESQSSYSGGFTGYTVCEKELVDGLRGVYPQVLYQEEDFEEYDAYFTIKGYEEMPDNLEEAESEGCWSGCILVKENKFYFGNTQNPITGDLLEQLLDVLGGYEHSQERISTEE